MKLQGKPKDQVTTLAGMLPVGKEYLVCFGKHSAPAILQEVKLATQKEVLNIPDKRPGEDGKMYTPSMARLVFDTFKINIVLEDYDIFQHVDGVTFTAEWGKITIREHIHDNSSIDKTK